MTVGEQSLVLFLPVMNKLPTLVLLGSSEAHGVRVSPCSDKTTPQSSWRESDGYQIISSRTK